MVDALAPRLRLGSFAHYQENGIFWSEIVVLCGFGLFDRENSGLEAYILIDYR